MAHMGRSVRRLESGAQHLRAIAAEGGIPVRRLSDQRGSYRAAPVGLVADLSRIGLGCPQDVALGFAARRTWPLPVGYRTREYHAPFVDFAFAVLELRELAPDGMSAQAIEPFLDRVKPGWSDALSLRLDWDAARILWPNAVLVSARHRVMTDPMTPVLRRGENDHWSAWIEGEEAADLRRNGFRASIRIDNGCVWHRSARFRFPLDTGVTENVVAPNVSAREVTLDDDPRRRIRFDGVPQGWLLCVASGKPQQTDAEAVVVVRLDAFAERQARLPLAFAGPHGAQPMTLILNLPRPRGAFQTVAGEILASNRDISSSPCAHDGEVSRPGAARSSHREPRVRVWSALPWAQ